MELATKKCAYDRKSISYWENEPINILASEFIKLCKLKQKMDQNFFMKKNIYKYIWLYDHKLEEIKNYLESRGDYKQNKYDL